MKPLTLIGYTIKMVEMDKIFGFCLKGSCTHYKRRISLVKTYEDKKYLSMWVQSQNGQIYYTGYTHSDFVTIVHIIFLAVFLLFHVQI